MAKTLLAVDDSVTMRKVLEITFSGEDFRVITAENGQGAIAKIGENPAVLIVDTSLGGEDGYALAKELRRRAPGAALLMLASRYGPYDQARGRDAGVDDWADKPFDTQQLLDKVRKILVSKEAGGAAAGAPAAAPAAAQSSPALRPQGASAQAAQPGRAATPAAGAPVPRTGTLLFGEQQQQQQGMPAAPIATGPRPAPVGSSPQPGAPVPPAPVQSAATTVSANVNGQLASKLGGLGLTPQQADAVLALSRDLVERVVWEVVPQLAEALIKEEIARLTKD